MTFSFVWKGGLPLAQTLFSLGLLFAVPSYATEGGAIGTNGWERIAELPLPGDPTRYDYLSLDPYTGRLYLAHLGDGRLVVVDTRSRKVAADLPGFPNIHGVLAVPQMGRVYATVSPKSRKKPGSLVVVDMKNLGILARIPTGSHPDGLDFEPRTGRIFVSNEWGKSLTVIDSAHNTKIKTIPLHGEVGNTRVEVESHRVFSTVQTRNLLVRIDPFALHVDRTYPLPCHHPHGLVINETERVAYVACEKDDRLLSVDLGSGQVVSSLPTGRKPDVLSFDASRNLLFVASESGVVTVASANGKELKLLATTNLGFRAHSILADPGTHQVYLPLENMNGHPVLEILEFHGDDLRLRMTSRVHRLF